MSTAIRIQNISKSYEQIKALQGISLEVAKGERFGLIGPDGAGKTSLIRILTSLLLPDKGTAQVEGYDVVKDYQHIRQIIGYMPGRFSLYQDLTIEENLNFFATVFGTTVKENYDLIRDIYVQIEPFKKRRAGKLSGGMKQKLALCCALIHEPKVLFLDEPTTGVDPVSRQEFWDMLKRLQKREITIFVSTPYMDEAERCDRVALIQDGAIMGVDTPQALTRQFKYPLLAVRAANMYKLMQDLRQLPEVHTVYPFGEYLHLSTLKPIGSEPIRNWLLDRKHEKVEVFPTVPTIEDIFMEMMRGVEATPTHV